MALSQDQGSICLVEVVGLYSEEQGLQEDRNEGFRTEVHAEQEINNSGSGKTLFPYLRNDSSFVLQFLHGRIRELHSQGEDSEPCTNDKSLSLDRASSLTALSVRAWFFLCG